MSGGLIGIAVQLIAGAAAGNLIGALSRERDLGAIGNHVAGALGGGIGGQIVGAIVSNESDIYALIQRVIAGGIGGSLLMAIAGAVKQRRSLIPGASAERLRERQF